MDYRHYLDEYALTHQHPINVKIHNVCVPLIAWSSLGLTHSFSVANYPLSYGFSLLTLVLYGVLFNLKIMLMIFMALIIFLVSYDFIPDLRWFMLFIFAASWAGQFYGHYLEGKKPSFTQDLVFLLVGPVWVFQKILGRKV